MEDKHKQSQPTDNTKTSPASTSEVKQTASNTAATTPEADGSKAVTDETTSTTTSNESAPKTDGTKTQSDDSTSSTNNATTTETTTADAEKKDTPETTGSDTRESASPVQTANESVDRATVANGDTAAANKLPVVPFIAGVLTSLVIWQLYSITTNTTPTPPDTTGAYPDPVALVEGEPIDQELFLQNVEQSLSAAATQGQNIEDPNVRENIEQEALDMIINTRLLVAAAAEAGYEATEAEVDEQIAALEEQFGSAEVLNEELNRLGLNAAELRKDVAEQISVDDYLTTEVIPQSTAVAEAEIEEIYQGLVDAGQEMPPLSEVRDAIEAQVRQQQQQTAVGDFIETLRAAADIEVRL